jgi:hypothetical protein
MRVSMDLSPAIGTGKTKTIVEGVLVLIIPQIRSVLTFDLMQLSFKYSCITRIRTYLFVLPPIRLPTF